MPSEARSLQRSGAAEKQSDLLRAGARALDVCALMFAAWTMLVHGMVFAVAGTFATLRWLGLLLLPLTYLAYRASADPQERLESGPPSPLPLSDRGIALVVAAALIALLPLTGSYLWFWGASTLALLLACIASLRGGGAVLAGTTASRDAGRWLAVLAGFAAIVTLVSHRPDTDDGFLINIPVWLLDNADKAMYSEDGLHNLPGMPIIFPTYRAHSVEVFYAFAAWLLHVEPIEVAHLILPPLSSVAAILSSALLLRALLPRAWPCALSALAVFWFTMGDTHEGFANHAYVRIFQGKAIMVTAVLPYLAFAVIRYMNTGRWRHWLPVLAAVVCAGGLSATGLFVAPLALGAAAVASWTPGTTPTKRLAGALACALHPLALALGMRGQVLEKLDIVNSAAIYGHLKTFGESYGQILGAGPYMYLQVFGVLGAVAAAPDRGARRWLAGLGLVYFALAMNPFLFDFWVRHVTTAPVAWRLWWIVPLPVLVAAAIGSLLEGNEAIPRRGVRIACCAGLVAVTFGLTPGKWSVSAGNGVTFAWPRLKVPPGDYAVSETIQRLTPPGYSVLAPRELVMWVTTRRHHPRVVAHKDNALKVMAPYLGPMQFNLRMHLLFYVAGSAWSPGSALALSRSLESLRIGLVAHPRAGETSAEIEGVMRRASFKRQEAGGYVLWHRDASANQGTAPP